ncbi:MAG: hypothetical protein C4291_07850 [Candidatus Dadabacteria bacterium]
MIGVVNGMRKEGSNRIYSMSKTEEDTETYPKNCVAPPGLLSIHSARQRAVLAWSCNRQQRAQASATTCLEDLQPE